MKKLLFLTILLIMFMCNISAHTLALEEPIISFSKPSGYDLQGYTVVNNNIFIILVDYDDSSSIIKVYNLDSHSSLKEFKFDSLGHANDVTYNNKSNTIYVLHAGGTKTISSFDGDSFEYINTFNIDYPARSLSYVEDVDGYVIRNFAMSYKLDNTFSCIGECLFMIIPDLKYETCRQGWAYYDGYLYYANWSWIKQGGDGSNTIKRYDLDGNFIDDINTDTNIGELEDVSFYNNKMILGFSGYDKIIKFYETDIPNINKEKALVVDEIKEETNEEVNLLYYLVIPLLLVFSILIVIFIIKKHKV